MKDIADTLEVSRSNQYEKLGKLGPAKRMFYKKAEDGEYLGAIREITDQRPTYGYRRVTAVLNRSLKNKGQSGVNHKRIYRIMKINNLLLQRHTGHPGKVHDGTVMTFRSNMRWCSDGFEISCWNGDRLRVAFSMDCCDREILSYAATTGGICGEMVRDLMAEAMEYRFGQADRLPQSIECIILPKNWTGE